jgi:hypothetical protein
MTQKMLAYIGNFVHGRKMGEDQSRDIDGSVSETQPKHVHLFDINEDGNNNNEYNGDKHGLVQRQVSSRSGNQQMVRALSQQRQPQQQVVKLLIVESAPIGDEQQMPYGQESYGGQQTRSRKLLELHRQQMLDEGLWMQRKAQLLGAATTTSNGHQHRSSQSGQDGAQLPTGTETSLATVLLLTASIVILALMSVCVVLSVMIVRYNTMANCHDVGISPMGVSKRQQQFNSSSTCNICDDSQGGSIDAVLHQQASAKKNEHAFCNVFAKLRNHHQQANVQQQQQQQQQHNQTTTLAGVKTLAATGDQAQVAAVAQSGQHKVEQRPQ